MFCTRYDSKCFAHRTVLDMSAKFYIYYNCSPLMQDGWGPIEYESFPIDMYSSENNDYYMWAHKDENLPQTEIRPINLPPYYYIQQIPPMYVERQPPPSILLTGPNIPRSPLDNFGHVVGQNVQYETLYETAFTQENSEIADKIIRHFYIYHWLLNEYNFYLNQWSTICEVVPEFVQSVCIDQLSMTEDEIKNGNSILCKLEIR